MQDDGTMEVEVVLVPRDEDVQAKIGDAAAWPEFAGELRYRWFSTGVGEAGFAEVIGSGVDLVVSDAAPAGVYAVVPGPDGFVRPKREDPKRFL